MNRRTFLGIIPVAMAAKALPPRTLKRDLAVNRESAGTYYVTVTREFLDDVGPDTLAAWRKHIVVHDRATETFTLRFPAKELA